MWEKAFEKLNMQKTYVLKLKEGEKYVCKQNPYFSHLFTLLFAKKATKRCAKKFVFTENPFV